MDRLQHRRTAWWVALVALLLVGVIAARFSRAKDVDSLEDNLLKGVDDDLKKGGHQGRFVFQIDGPDGKPVEALRSVRGIPGQFSVAEFPRGFGIEGHSLFQAGQRLDTNVAAAGVKIFCDAPADADGEFARYASKCSANLPTGKYTIDPFGLTFEVGQDLRSTHPAIVIQGLAVHIRTAAVTFRAVDARTGMQTPLVQLGVACNQTDLLKDLLETKGQIGFNPLTLYLPVGTSYRSSLGDFSIDDAGGVHPSATASFEGGAFVQKIERPAKVVTTESAGKGYWVASQNLRHVYRRGETAPFVVFSSGNLPAPKLPVIAKGMAGEVTLGELNLPAAAGVDSKLFLLDTSALAPGKYELSMKGPDAHPFGIEVVDLLATTPLFLFTVNACGESNFTTDSAGLDQLRDTGVRCWTSYGFGGGLDAKGPGTVPYPAPAADAPFELKRGVSDARALLDDCLRHGLTTIDFEARRQNFYNEGLAYHHTHPISVDRMVRRVQIFGQELGDYPAFTGMSYTWFPALGGYTEGGVRTDPYFEVRMQMLEEKVKQSGVPPFTREERQQWSKLQRGNQPIPQEMADKRRNFWRAQQHIGFYDSFDLYNHKLREVRKDFIATTSGNAGHDEGIHLSDFAGAHNALTWESYTDYGDWPMSAGFCSDWARGMAPGIPQWLQVEPSQSEPSIVGKQFYKLARGTEGIGVGVHDPGGARINARRAKSNKFIERYGSLVSGYQPDMTVAICVNELEGRYEYNAHALHSHLTRLGYGPVIVSEETIEKGMPAGVKVLMLPNARVPFSLPFQANVKQFMASGGKVVLVGEHCLAMEGAIRVEVPLKQLWDIGGFAAHLPFWEEFKNVRPALEKAMADLGLAAPNGAAPEKAVILPMRSGGVRYAVVISSPLTAKDTEFVPVSGVVVKVGAPVKVVNLVTGQTLAVNNGTVNVDLVNEPVAMLALLDAEPAGITLKHPAQMKAGEEIELACDVKPAPPGNGGVPVQYVITDSSGKQRAVFYRLSGAGRAVRYATSSTELAGEYSVAVTELLTGLTAKAKVKVTTAPAIAAIAEVPRVYLPHADRIPLFLSRTGEVRVIVEETQAQDVADAERVVVALKKAGRAASLEKVEPSSYDTFLLRWYPRKHENDVLAQIDAGNLIGYRVGLKAYINTSTREHVPEKGGWSDIAPDYIVRNDCVLFTGGKLCESLRAVSDWIQTPNMPGKGTGVIEVGLSPFWADREAVALISNDDAGRKGAVDRLIELIENGGKNAAFSPFTASQIAAASTETNGAQRIALETPLKGFVPPALAVRAVASADGYSVVQTVNATQLVSPEGKVLRALPASGLPPSVATGGVYFGASVDITQRDPSWNFPTGWKVIARIADAKGGSSALDIPGEVDWIGDRFPGWNGGYAVSPDGKSYFAGQAGGGFILFGLNQSAVGPASRAGRVVSPAEVRLGSPDLPGTGGTYRRFAYDPRAVGFYDAARAPQFVSSARFSSDGRYVAFTMGTHPTGYGGMGRPPFSPYASEICCVRVSDGQIVWRHAANNLRDGSFSSSGDSIAASDEGKRVAIIDWDQEAVLFDEAGKELYRKPVFDWKERYGKRGWAENKPAWRAEITHDGAVTMYASADSIVLVDGTGAELARITVPGLCDIRLSADGSHVYAADADGGVTCFNRKGTKLWFVQTQGDAPKLATAPIGVLVAEGAGSLLLLNDKGVEVRRTPLVSMTSQAPADVKWSPIPVAGPALYREPQTLAVMQKFGAKLAGHWEPQGAVHSAFGRNFYAVDTKLTFSTPGKESHLVHLVYRHHAPAGKGPGVTLTSGSKSRTFLLDLPTPEYRVVDLPCEEAQNLAVAITPVEGLEVAELSVYSIAFPGTNIAYVQPASAGLDHVAGIEVGGENKKKPKGEDLDILDDKDPSQVGKASAGKMKNALIFANNTDPDQVEGHYLRATGNALDNLDGRKFLDGKTSFWTNAKDGKWGTRLVVDLNHHARPKLCATYERTLRQSEVMRAIVVLRGGKSDMEVDGDHPGPDKLAIERRGVGGLLDNDQFFNVFDVGGVEMDALGIYIYSGRGKDHGLSEIELYE